MLRPFRISSSIIRIAVSTPSSVMLFLLSLSCFKSLARIIALASSCSFRRASARPAVSRRPDAFRQGPRTKPAWYTVTGSLPSPAASIRQRIPVLSVWDSSKSPSRTMIRFSSRSGITSQIAASAAKPRSSLAIFTCSSSSADFSPVRSGFPRRSSASLNTTSAPQIFGNLAFGSPVFASGIHGSAMTSAGGKI